MIIAEVLDNHIARILVSDLSVSQLSSLFYNYIHAWKWCFVREEHYNVALFLVATNSMKNAPH